MYGLTRSSLGSNRSPLYVNGSAVTHAKYEFTILSMESRSGIGILPRALRTTREAAGSAARVAGQLLVRLSWPSAGSCFALGYVFTLLNNSGNGQKCDNNFSAVK